MMESSPSYLEKQKGTRKKLIDLLYKKAYCLCIPEPNLVQSLLDKVNKGWIQTFLLKKNPSGLSVIPMFVLILFKNRLLQREECEELVNLIHLLMSQFERADFDSILFEKNINSNNMGFFYYLFSALMQTEPVKVNEALLLIRIQGFYKCLQLFLAKASVEAISCLVLDPEEKGFHLIQQAMYSIGYSALSETQMAYVLGVTKSLIYQSSQEVIDNRGFQRYEGFCFIWYGIATWLMVIKEEVSDRFRIECLAALITALLDTVSKKNLSRLLLQDEGEAIILILSYIFFTELSEQKKLDRNFLDSFFIFWLEKIISNTEVEQLVIAINKTFLLIQKEAALSYCEKYKVASQFFTYVIRFANVSSQQRAQLSCVSERLSAEFVSFHLSGKRLSNSLRHHFSLFKQRFCLRNYTVHGALNENFELNEQSALVTHAF